MAEEAGQSARVAATIERDLPCLGCDYNLRGLSEDGNCPECGRAVAAALRHDTLERAEPLWLARAHLGLVILAWATLIHAVMAALTMLPVVVEFRPRGVLAVVWQSRVWSASPVLMWLGAWLLTLRRPDRTEAERPPLRMLLRISATVYAIVQCVPLSLLLPWTMRWDPFVLLAYVVAACTTACTALYVRELARRGPNVAVVYAAPYVLWGSLVAYAGILLYLINAIRSPTGEMPTTIFALCYAVVVLCEATLFVLLLRMGRTARVALSRP